MEEETYCLNLYIQEIGWVWVEKQFDLIGHFLYQFIFSIWRQIVSIETEKEDGLLLLTCLR